MFGKFLISFDVESGLFTNIPLEECIDLAVKYISEGKPDLKLTPSDLKRLFSFATAETHFLFKGSFYDQIDGVAMGSPLAPVLANLFMGHHEKIWLEQYQGPEVLFYRRYVDDTFCLFHSEQDAIAFFDYINSQHPNIRFTMEREVDHVLPFLDVLIDNTNRGSVVTSTFRKKTFTGLLTNYLSFAPLSYKIGLIRALIDRVFKINNTWLGFHKDIVNLVFILRKNLFPVHLIDKCVYRYLNTAIDRNSSIQNTTSQGKQYFYKLPYLGRFSTIAQSQIRRLLNRYCHDLDIKLVFTTFKLRNIFSVKDSVPRELRSRVIYKFTCACCNACYMGETGRHFFHTRP